MNRDLPTIVISDLDSTLMNTKQRHHLANKAIDSGDWDAYSLECINDDLIVGTATALRLMYPHHQIHLVSGRSVVSRQMTEDVLGLYKLPYDKLVLYDRSLWNHRPSNGEIKVKYIEEVRALGYQVVLFLEDWEETAKAIEAVGVPVLCVNPRYSITPITHL